MLLFVRLMAVFRRGVVSRDVRRGDIDSGACGDGVCDLLIGVPLLAESFNLIADHPDERLDGKHLGS